MISEHFVLLFYVTSFISLCFGKDRKERCELWKIKAACCGFDLLYLMLNYIIYDELLFQSYLFFFE